MQRGDILFIDEIHRLSPHVEEVMYPAMEDFRLDIVIGEGMSARSVKIDLQPFTLIGATTRAGMLTSPLRDRFGIVQRLEFYDEASLAVIVERSAQLSHITIDSEGAAAIARRARGTPRIANRLLRRVRDYAIVQSQGGIDASIAQHALDNLQVDAMGLDQLDRNILRAIIERFNGGPVGVESLAAALSEAKTTIEDVVEPYLLQNGYIERTSRGRIATKKTYSHFGLAMPHNQLF